MSTYDYEFYNKTSFHYDVLKASEEHRIIRVVGYSRVSTHHKDQLQSLYAQKDSIESFVAKYEEVELIENFYEQASAKNDLRDMYASLLHTIKSQNIDYILVKDDARLNRSVENTMRLINLLLDCNVKMFFLMDGITIDVNNPNDIERLQLNSIFNERLARDQSNKGRYAFSRKCKEKRLSRQNECFGFRYNTTTQQMELEPFESEIIKKIFEKFVYEDKGCTRISRELFDLGVHGFGNNLYLSPQAILKYLRNSAYYGDMTFNHRRSGVFKTGHGAETKREATSKEDYIHVSVPPIVSKELFDLAQRKLDENAKQCDARFDGTRTKAKFLGTHIFSTKVLCGDCGSVFYFKWGGKTSKIPFYVCSQKKKAQRKNKNRSIEEISRDSLKECENPYGKIHEDVLIAITQKALELSKSEREECFANVEKAIKFALANSKKNECISDKLRKEIKQREKDMEKYVTSLTLIDDVDVVPIIASKIKSIKEEIERLESKLEDETQHETRLTSANDRIEQIKKSLSSMMIAKEITQDEVQRYIDYIKINPSGLIDITLNFGTSFFFNYNDYSDVPNKNVGDISLSSQTPCKVVNIVTQDDLR